MANIHPLPASRGSRHVRTLQVVSAGLLLVLPAVVFAQTSSGNAGGLGNMILNLIRLKDPLLSAVYALSAVLGVVGFVMCVLNLKKMAGDRAEPNAGRNAAIWLIVGAAGVFLPTLISNSGDQLYGTTPTSTASQQSSSSSGF